MIEAELEKEGPSGTEYAFSVQTAPLGGDVTIESELRHMKEAILSWSQRRGQRCALLRIQVLAPAAEHTHVMRVLERVYNDEMQLAPILQRLTVQIAMLDESGRPVEELEIPANVGEDQRRRKTPGRRQTPPSPTAPTRDGGLAAGNVDVALYLLREARAADQADDFESPVARHNGYLRQQYSHISPLKAWISGIGFLGVLALLIANWGALSSHAAPRSCMEEADRAVPEVVTEWAESQGMERHAAERLGNSTGHTTGEQIEAPEGWQGLKMIYVDGKRDVFTIEVLCKKRLIRSGWDVKSLTILEADTWEQQLERQRAKNL